MKIEVTKDRILEAASKCSQAKETLKTLFPEVFEEENKEALLVNDGCDRINDRRTGEYVLELSAIRPGVIWLNEHCFKYTFGSDSTQSWITVTRK